MFKRGWLVQIVILALLLSACGTAGNNGSDNAGTADNGNQQSADNTGGSQGGTITIFSSLVNQAGWEDLTKAFEKQTGVKVNSVKSPDDYSAIVQKLTVSLSSGDDAYDVIYIDELMAKNFQSAGFLQPFGDDVFAPDVLENFNQDSLASFSRKDDSYYTVPGTTDAMVLFVNKKLFDDAGIALPTTGEQFLDAARKLSKADGSQYGYGASWSKGGQLFNDAIRWATAFGGDYNDWSNPNTQKAFQAMHDYIYKDKITPKTVLGDSYDALTENFVDGKYAMMYHWQSAIGKMGDRFGKDLLVIPNMTFATNKTIGASWFYAVNKNSKHSGDAVKFMKWIASNEGQSALMQLPAHTSGSKKALSESEFLINQNMSAYLEANSIAPRPLTVNVNEIMDKTETILSKYLSDQITLEQAVADGQKVFADL